jgi:hypothetical protein
MARALTGRPKKERDKDMRRNLLVALALSAVLALGVAAVATAKFDTFRAGNLILQADGGVSPKALPKKKMAPVKLHIKGKISTSDGTHASAFREATIDFDKNGSINTKGLPVCKRGELEARDTKAARRPSARARGGSRSPSPNSGRSRSMRRSRSSTAAPRAARRRCSSTRSSPCRSRPRSSPR